MKPLSLSAGRAEVINVMRARVDRKSSPIDTRYRPLIPNGIFTRSSRVRLSSARSFVRSSRSISRKNKALHE